MQKPRISIIIPVFNAAKYLREALASVQQQGFSDWEICAVDDGSTDDSLSILQDYASQDPRLRFFQQSHAGPAEARYCALQEVRGEYVFCLDADDVLSEDALEKMEEKARQSQADLVIPDMEMFWNTPQAFRWNVEKKIDIHKVLKGEEAFAQTFPWRIHTFMLMKTASMKGVYNPHNLPFRSFNSDEYLSRKMLLRAQKMVFSEGVYCYRYNEESITHQNAISRFQEMEVLPHYLSLAQECSYPDQRKVQREIICTLFHLLSTAHRWTRCQKDKTPLTTAKGVFLRLSSLRPGGGINPKQRIIYTSFRLGFRIFSFVAQIRSYFL